MLNAGILASSSSLVLVPDLSNFNLSQVNSALQTAGLVVGTVTTTATNATSSNSGLVSTQSPMAGTLVERFTQVNYVTYSYTAPTPTPGGGGAPVTPTPANWYASGCCNGSPIYDSDNDYYVLNQRFTASCSGGTLTNASIGNTSFMTVDCTPAPVPAPSSDIPVWYGSACCGGTVITSSSAASSSNVYDNLDANCINNIIYNERIILGTFGNPSYPSITCSTSPAPVTPPSTTWYCSYNGTDGRAQTTQTSDLTDTSGCDYAVRCSTSGYPEYPPYTGCAPAPAPAPSPSPTPTPGIVGEGTCGSSCGNCQDYGCTWYFDGPYGPYCQC
jgi:hypothetical protein